MTRTEAKEEGEILAWFTAGDLHTFIEILDALEESYDLDVKEGILREDSELIEWSRRMKKILAMILKSAGSPHEFRYGIKRRDVKDSGD